jgi:transposase
MAAAFGLNVRTVFTCLAKFSDDGEEALWARPIPERPPKVSDEEMRWIAQAVRDYTPQPFQFEYGLCQRRMSALHGGGRAKLEVSPKLWS